MSTKEGPPARTARAMRAERRHQLRETAQPSNDSRDPQIDPSPNQDTQGTTGQISEPLAENVVTAPGPSFPSTLSSVPSNISGREDANTEATNHAESPPGQNSGKGSIIKFGTIGDVEEDGVSVRTHDPDQAFLTAPAGPESSEEGPSSRPAKGKERARFAPSQGYSLTWDNVTESSHRDDDRSEKKWTLINEMLQYWASNADQMRGDYDNTETELNSIQFRVLDSRRRLEDMASAMADIQSLATQLIANVRSPTPIKKEEPSLHEQHAKRYSPNVGPPKTQK
ncbi:hypothetical protein BC826DRAFT_974428, partial [Russula brevipes]